MLRPLLAAIAALFVGFTAPASAQAVGGGEPRRTGFTEASLISERTVVRPGDTFLVGLRLSMDPHWHIYWRTPGGPGLPPDIRWTLPEGAAVGPFLWQPPHMMPLEGLMQYGFDGDFVLPFEVTVPRTLAPGDVFAADALASWLICKDLCVPEETAFSVSWPVAAAQETDATGAEQIADALSRVPPRASFAVTKTEAAEGWTFSAAGPELKAALVAGVGSARLFPYGEEVDHNRPQKLAVGAEGLTLTLTRAASIPDDQGLAGVLVLEPATPGGPRLAWEVAPTATDGPLPGTSGTARGSDQDWLAATGGKLGGGEGTGGTGTTSGGQSLPPGAGMSLPVLMAALGAALLGGLILNLMPCVLPVLSIKALSLVKTAHGAPGAARAEGLAYLAGVVLCFVAIGGVLLALRSAGQFAGLGFQLQNPAVVAGLTLLMLLIGLNLAGLFEIGQSLTATGQGLTERTGTTGAFFTGLLAAVIGAPCVGPFMATAVGALITQSWPIVLLTFAVIGLGMALPVVALSFSPALRRFVPKPGAWMERFKQVLAFPMFLTAVWLLWVLAGLAGPDAVIGTVTAAVALAFGLWLWGVVQQSAAEGAWGWAGRFAGGLAVLAAFGFAVHGASLTAPPALAGTTATAAGGAGATNVESIAWSPETQTALLAEGRPVFVDFTARWCITCQVNKRTSLTHPDVQAAFVASNVAFLIADWTDNNSLIGEELARHGRAGVPLYLFYPAGGTTPVVLPQMLSPQLVVDTVTAAG
jgi:thiol:disulfide interchange protein DsbD